MVLLVLLAALGAAAAGVVLAQGRNNPVAPPEPPPPPLPPRAREKAAEDSETSKTLVEPILEETDAEWGLSEELAAMLAARTDEYREYTRKFTCIEEARLAEYVNGVAERERSQRYSYLLTTDSEGAGFLESRREVTKSGNVRKSEVRDEESFPPAYAWVFLFSRRNQQYFSFRDRGDRFDGFDWIREIEFRGALPFTDGRDIRQWEGVALVDASTHAPIEIIAEPSNQRRRLKARFERWATAFNLAGWRLAPRPFGFRCRVEFRHLAEGLNFPTRLRYDTFRAVSMKAVIPWKASTRGYSSYRFFQVDTGETLGDRAD
jgi:hypothetical protein